MDKWTPEQVAKIRPYGNRALIRRDPTGGRMANSLLFLPETKNTDEKACTVLAVGQGVWCAEKKAFIPPEIQPGDRVCILQYDGEKLGQCDGAAIEIVDIKLIEAVIPNEAKNI